MLSPSSTLTHSPDCQPPLLAAAADAQATDLTPAQQDLNGAAKWLKTILPNYQNFLWEDFTWEELIWQHCKFYNYRQKIWDPLSQKLRFGPGFLKTVNDLAADWIALINHRLDQLSFCLESQLRDNPSSLDFKKLRGNPRPPSTHECDAWSNLDAKRLFGHFEGDIFILDALGDHL